MCATNQILSLTYWVLDGGTVAIHGDDAGRFEVLLSVVEGATAHSHLDTRHRYLLRLILIILINQLLAHLRRGFGVLGFQMQSPV